jgi:hypothetical protein
MAHRFWKGLALSTALVAALVPGFAQKPTIIRLIPAANWKQVSSERLGLEAARDYGGDPAIEREYGVQTLEHRTYQLASARADVVVEPAADTSAAYGLLTYYRTESMAPEKGIQLALSGPEGALMVRGRNFIRFRRPKGSRLSDDQFRALLIFVGGTRPSLEALANLPRPLPAEGRIPGTEKYLLGPEATRRVLPSFRVEQIGFGEGAEVQLAEYQSGKGRAAVMAIAYPTPQIARIRFAAMTASFGINKEHGPGALYGRRQGSFVLLVLNADSSATATKLIDQFWVAQQLSWNERYPGRKSFTLQVVELVLANIMLSFILAGFCVLGGILFFLSMRLAAKWFPDLSWGHPDEDTLIRLNLR